MRLRCRLYRDGRLMGTRLCDTTGRTAVMNELKAAASKYPFRKHYIEIMWQKSYKPELTEKDIEDITALYDTGMYTQKSLAETFGYTRNTIQRVVTAKAPCTPA